MALRYLWGAEGQSEGRSFLRFVTYVAIGGVAVGVAALLLALAVVRGFSHQIERKIIGFGAHIQVTNYAQDEPLENAPFLKSELEGMNGVSRVTSVVRQPVLLRRSERAIDGVVLLGFDRAPSYLANRMVAGSFDVDASEGHSGIVVGKELAMRLGLKEGQLVTLFALQNNASETASELPRPRLKQFRIRGIYNTSLKEIDDVYVFTDLPPARWLSSMPKNSVSRFNLTVRNSSQIDSVAARIENRFGFPVATQTVFERFAGLFAWVDLQQSIIPLVIGVIVVVAAFNIIGALLMMIVEKTREMGILQSLGASAQTLKRLFLLLGLMIGAVGTGIGGGAALVLGLIQQRFEIIPLPAEAYYMTTAPIELNPVDFALVALITLILCSAAAYIPARIAARVEPVQALRFE